MAHKITYETAFRRRREGKTDYKKRLALLKSKKMRVVVRRSNKGFSVQLVDFNANGDRVLATVRSNELKAFGWNTRLSNLPAAYLLGVLAGHRFKALKTASAVLDLGLQHAHHGGTLFAVAKGVIDAGVLLNINEAVLPSPERLSGKHIQGFSQNVDKTKQSILNSSAKTREGF